MLEYLRLSGVGPAPALEAVFADRLNLITGDNGLGKSFLLDIAWWVLSRTWTGLPARPQPAHLHDAEIGFSFHGRAKRTTYVSRYDRFAQAWRGKPGRPANPGLVLYAQVDGGFAVWDPARNYWRREDGGEGRERPAAYLFKPGEVWNGLRGPDIQNTASTLDSDPLGLFAFQPRYYCNGLIADWAGWQRENGEHFEQLCRALATLSPSPDEVLVPGPLVRINLNDARDIPTIRMPYGQDVPVLHASAGMKRVLAMAYLLVWTWQEHVRASELLGQEPARQIVFLIDEIEGHLHPRWQRRVFRAVLEVMNALLQRDDVQVQIVAATHSPLILASLEPLFDERRDRIFDLELVPVPDAAARVELQTLPWRRRGEADNWLTSELFGLKSARSLEAEQLIEAAADVMATGDAAVNAERARDLDRRLRQVLGDTDPFWLRWRYVGERQGWL
ncbi:MAG TPA: ATP-binding protein [Plasticicumulans sp.]|nr:ATP-binding protein [Plasticicumulans sp.]HMW44008.1 ATP-binding protein [Plasticicumulans sp.]HMZ09636.1 ATP-binding protein [Plasticicumulans sp.]